MQWKRIGEDTPRQLRPMIVVRAFNVPVQQGAILYTSDPYCVWHAGHTRDGDDWARWPHPFQPTHWCPLPDEEPEA